MIIWMKEILDDVSFGVYLADFMRKMLLLIRHIQMMMMKVYENLFFVLIFVLNPNKNNYLINYCIKGLKIFSYSSE